MGFDIVGFGCTTCIGNSGALPEQIEAARVAGRATPVAILSGNRNFPGRVHPDATQAFLMSPMLVVAYALLGDAAHDLESAVLGRAPDGSEIHLADRRVMLRLRRPRHPLCAPRTSPRRSR